MDQSAELVALLGDIAAGRRRALGELYSRTSAKLFGVCLRILNDRSEAEDVLQETFVTVWRRAASFEPTMARPMTWMIVIARSRAIDRLRSTRHMRAAAPIDDAPEVSDPAPNPLEDAVSAGERRALDQCLGTLDEDSVAAIRRAFFEGVTYEEIAREGGVPLGTMKSRIRRGLMKLKACLNDE